MRSPSSKYLISSSASGSSAFTPLREHVPLPRKGKICDRMCVEDPEVCRCHRCELKGSGGGGWDSWMMTDGKWLGKRLVVKRFNSWRVAPIETPPLFDSQFTLLHDMACRLPIRCSKPHSKARRHGGYEASQTLFCIHITAASYA